MRELRQFVEVATRRSISSAAKHLNISQPALSRAIRKLEESYGAPLFVRNGAGVELSIYGSALYSRAMRVLPALDEAREEIEQLQGRAKAVIRVAAGDLWGYVVLPDILREFSVTHPNVVVHLEVADEGTRVEGLRNGIYDLMFGTMSSRYEPIVAVEFEPMLRQATYVYCDETHPLAAADQVSKQQLLDQRWISPGYEDDIGPTGLLGQACDFALRFDTLMSALLALQGSPFLMAASSGFAPLFASFGITPLQAETHGSVDQSGAIYPPRALDNAAVRDFIRSTRQSVAAMRLPSWPEAHGSAS